MQFDRHGIPILVCKKKKKKPGKKWVLPFEHFSVEKLYHRQGGKCFYCSQPIQLVPWSHQGNKPLGYTKDHFFAKSKGFTLKGNMVLACYPCNTEKDARPPTDEEIKKFELLYRVTILVGEKDGNDFSRAD